MQNRHHVWFNRKSYYTPTQKALRYHQGFVIPASAYDHQLLHAQMKPMVVPTKAIIDDILDYIGPSEKPEARFDTLAKTIGFLTLQSQEHYSEDYAYRADRLAAHLSRQMGYLALHDVPPRFSHEK